MDDKIDNLSLKEILINENILKKYTSSIVGYRVNIWVYRNKEILKNFYKKYPIIEKKIDSYRSFEDFIACILMDLKDIPKCNFCDSYQKLYKTYPFYRDTCGCNKCADLKSKETRLKKYGSKTWNNPIKNRETNLKNHDGILAQRTEETINKTKETCLKKFGAIAPVCNSVIRNKIRKTTYKNHGVECMFSLDSVKKLKVEGCRKKYNSDYYLQSESFKEYCRNNFGGENPMCSAEISGKTNPKYKLNGILFDSAPEIYYYIFNRDMGNTITRSPLSLDYINSFDNSLHRYMVDFKVNEDLVEIKGENLVDLNGNWIPLKKDIKKCKNKEEELKLRSLYLSKQECAIKNNVKIILSNSIEIKNMKKYVIKTYGDDFISSCKISKNKFF